MIIAIDGPAGAGKSTLARLLAARYGWTYLDTGAMYRAVTLLAMEQRMDLAAGDELGQLARDMEMGFQPGESGMPRVFAGCREVTEDIRLPEVTRNVSQVSAHQQVREELVRKQRQLMDCGNVVADGRDIGTVVCPEAEIKIFLIASNSERARRRRLELKAKGISVSQAEMEEEIAARDHYDSHREVAPLKAAPDSVTIDTTAMNIEAMVEKVAAAVDSRN